MAKMKFSFTHTENPDELKVAINNLGLHTAFFRQTTEGRPVIIYFICFFLKTQAEILQEE